MLRNKNVVMIFSLVLFVTVFFLFQHTNVNAQCMGGGGGTTKIMEGYTSLRLGDIIRNQSGTWVITSEGVLGDDGVPLSGATATRIGGGRGGGCGGAYSRRGGVVATPTPTPTPIPNATMRALAIKVPSGGAYTGACEGSPSARRVYEYLSGSPEAKLAWDPEDEREKFASFSSYLSGTVFSSTTTGPYAVTSQTQSGGTPVSLGVWQGYTYTLKGSYLGETYVPKRYCRILNGELTYSNGNILESVNVTRCTSLDPPCFLVAFTEPTGWYQVNGSGNSYAKTSLADQIPSAAVTAGATYDLSPVPGIVSSPIMDFTINPATTGEDIISSSAPDWNVKRSFTTSDLYTTFSYRLQDATKSATPENLQILSDGEKPPFDSSKESNVYLHNEDLTISNLWSINSDEKYIIMVTGNLTINNSIRLAAGATNAFLMFLVKGDISVENTIGGASGSTTPSLEGVYVTNGTFSTGVSTDPATERLVFKGSVIADSILLQRSLTGGQNSNASAELFIFNPDFLFSFPKIIKDLPYTWQEVAP